LSGKLAREKTLFSLKRLYILTVRVARKPAETLNPDSPDGFAVSQYLRRIVILFQWLDKS